MDETRLLIEELRRETRAQQLAMRRALLTWIDDLERIIGSDEPRTAELRKRYREGREQGDEST